MKVRQRVKQFLIPMLIGLTILTGMFGTSNVNSDKYYQSRGVAVTSLTLPYNRVQTASADDITDSLADSIIGNLMNKVTDLSDTFASKVANKGQDLPSGSYGIRDAYRRVYGSDTKSDDANINSIAEYIYSLRASNSIHSYTNGDILSQILSSLGQLVAGLGGIILIVLMAMGTLVDAVGSLIVHLVGYLNIFTYIGDALNNTVTSTGTNKAIRDGLSTFINLWVEFKPIVMTIATLLLMFVVVRMVMGTQGNRGRILGTGFAKYLSVFFAWGMLPFVLGGILSYGVDLGKKIGVVDTMATQVESTFYNAKAPFAAAFYRLPTDSDVSSEPRGGINSQRVYASWSNSKDLGLVSSNNGQHWTAVLQWMTGSSFDADDVNAMLGWSGDESDTHTNKGYFSHNTDSKGATEDDKGASWVKGHKFLADSLGTYSGGDVKGDQPVISDDNLTEAGFNDNLFNQTASGTAGANRTLGASDRLRKIAMTHAIAVWGIDASGKIPVSKDTGMNTSPKVQWNSVNLVGDTPIAKISNYSELVVQLFFTIMYAFVAYFGIVVILARSIGQALVDQLRASTGSIGAIARAILSVVLTILMVMYVVVTVQMVGPMITAVNSLLKGVINAATFGSGIGALAGQLTSIAALWMGGLLVVRLFMNLRGTLIDAATSSINQLAEAIDRAMGIQPGSDSSASAGMKRGADTARNTIIKGFGAMDSAKRTVEGGQRLATNGLKNAAELAAPAAELAATAYAGPGAGKAAGMALNGVANVADAATKAIDIDQTMDDAGEKNTAKAVKHNAKDAYDKARVGGASRMEAIAAAGSEAVETAAGNSKDVTDPNVDTARENGFNKAVTAKSALAAAADDKQTAVRSHKIQRLLADKTAMLTSQSHELSEAVQDAGAAQMAEQASEGHMTNEQATAVAQTQLQSAQTQQMQTSAARSAQKTTVDKAQEAVASSEEQLRQVQGSTRKQLASGQMTQPQAAAAIENARGDLEQKQEVLRTERDKMNTLVKTQREANQSVQRAQGAMKMVRTATEGQSADAQFVTPAGVQSTSEAEQHVRDTQTSLLKTKRDVNKLVKAANTVVGNTAVAGGVTAAAVGTTGTNTLSAASVNSSSNAVNETVDHVKNNVQNVSRQVQDAGTVTNTNIGNTGTNATAGVQRANVGGNATNRVSNATQSSANTVNETVDHVKNNVQNVSRQVQNAGTVTNTATGNTGTNASAGVQTASSSGIGSVSRNTSSAERVNQTVNENVQRVKNNVDNVSRQENSGTNVTNRTTGSVAPAATSRPAGTSANTTRRNLTSTNSVDTTVDETVHRAKSVVSNLEQTVQERSESYKQTSETARRAAQEVNRRANQRNFDPRSKDLTEDTN